MKREIKSMMLYFPHGISRAVADRISQEAVKYSQANISEGGMKILGFDEEGHELYSKDEMQFEFGKSRAKKPENVRAETFKEAIVDRSKR